VVIRFVIYGLLGWCGEIIWTALSEKVTGAQPGWRLPGTTYLWMFPIYGLIAPLYEPVHNLSRNWPWPARGLVYMLGFFAVEYLSGWLLRRLTGVCPWDYAARTRWHIHGLIRLDYAPVWFAVGLALEPVHDFLVRLTPAIYQALLYA
jgi:uncharacterized membrane protein